MIVTVLAVLTVITFVAFLVEATVEYSFGTAFDKLAEKYPKVGEWKWLLMYLALGLGVLVAFTFKFDVVNLLGQAVSIDIEPTPLGTAFTGLAIGRGSNFINDIKDKFFNQKNE